MAYDGFDLSGRVAFVTGGNSGIGLGMAHALAAAGADVSICGTNEDKNASAAAELERHGTRILASRCDVADEAQVEAAVTGTVSALGRIDACFANAGVGSRAKSFLEMETDEWRRVLSINLDGAFFTFRAAARHMVKRGGGGSLVVTSSLASESGQPRGQNYSASKGAVNSMVKALAVELGRHGIRANAVLPGWIETPAMGGLLDLPVMQDRVLKRVPIRRWGGPADLGGIAVYLASDASSYHTGDLLLIDGGYMAF